MTEEVISFGGIRTRTTEEHRACIEKLLREWTGEPQADPLTDLAVRQTITEVAELLSVVDGLDVADARRVLRALQACARQAEYTLRGALLRAAKAERIANGEQG